MIPREVIEQKIKDALNRYAGMVDPSDLVEAMKSIDSLTKVEVLLQLEEDFHTNVPEDEVDGWTLEETISFFMKEGKP